MSDIIYTPPASGGGTTINPTNNFIPVRSNATTFVDSILQCVPNSFVQSVRSGVGLGISTSFTLTTAETYIGDFNNLIDSKFIKVQNDTVTSRIYSSNSGFYLDFNSITYRFGDYNFVNNGIYLNVDDQNKQVSFTNNNNIEGLFIDYANDIYQFGNIAGKSRFIIDNINQFASIEIASIIYFRADKINNYVQMGDGAAFVYCNFSANFVDIGDFSSSFNGTMFSVDVNNEQIVTRNNGQDKGIYIEFTNTNYYLGDFNGIDKNTFLYIEDGNETIHFYTKILDFNGASLQSNTSGGNSGEHLVITLNGNQYKIKLENP
jgi:small nuclear ribonucleoprotein (snRNP)-like protein